MPSPTSMPAPPPPPPPLTTSASRRTSQRSGGSHLPPQLFNDMRSSPDPLSLTAPARTTSSQKDEKPSGSVSRMVLGKASDHVEDRHDHNDNEEADGGGGSDTTEDADDEGSGVVADDDDTLSAEAVVSGSSATSLSMDGRVEKGEDGDEDDDGDQIEGGETGSSPASNRSKAELDSFHRASTPVSLQSTARKAIAEMKMRDGEVDEVDEDSDKAWKNRVSQEELKRLNAFSSLPSVQKTVRDLTPTSVKEQKEKDGDEGRVDKGDHLDSSEDGMPITGLKSKVTSSSNPTTPRKNAAVGKLKIDGRPPLFVSQARREFGAVKQSHVVGINKDTALTPSTTDPKAALTRTRSVRFGSGMGGLGALGRGDDGVGQVTPAVASFPKRRMETLLPPPLQPDSGFDFNDSDQDSSAQSKVIEKAIEAAKETALSGSIPAAIRKKYSDNLMQQTSKASPSKTGTVEQSGGGAVRVVNMKTSEKQKKDADAAAATANAEIQSTTSPKDVSITPTAASSKQIKTTSVQSPTTGQPIQTTTNTTNEAVLPTTESTTTTTEETKPDPSSLAMVSSSQPLPPYSYDELLTRYQSRLSTLQQQEREAMEEYEGWQLLFSDWLSAGQAKEEERGTKRLKTRKHWVMAKEDGVEEKRMRLEKVKEAFRGAVEMLGEE